MRSSLKGVSYPIREKNDFSIVLEILERIRYHLHLRQKSRLEFHAADVLKKWSYPVSVQVTKELDFSDLDEEDSSYIEDKYLDLDILIFDEVVPKLPSRVLCKEDCKGLCPVCGTNLNEKSVAAIVRWQTLVWQRFRIFLRILRRCKTNVNLSKE